MNHPRDSRPVGLKWEDRAVEYLLDHGIEIIARSWRCRLGEIDIVGSDDEGLVIVEVKARSLTDRAGAREAVGHNKQQRIVGATRHFLMRNPAWSESPIRFDVLAIDGIDTPRPEISWVKNAFDAT